MKFLGKTHIIIMFVILFAYAVWIEIKLIEMYLEYEKTQKSFPCLHITGNCKVKPTAKNCEQFGSVPDYWCEYKLNREL